MSRMISNCPVKKPYINLNTGEVFERTNDRSGQPEESGKPEVNQKTVLKLYIKSESNKPHKVIR